MYNHLFRGYYSILKIMKNRKLFGKHFCNKVFKYSNPDSNFFFVCS